MRREEKRNEAKTNGKQTQDRTNETELEKPHKHKLFLIGLIV